jgi:hypothetical protein
MWKKSPFEVRIKKREEKQFESTAHPAGGAAVYTEDGIVHSRDSDTERTKYAKPLGHAVLELCLNPLYEPTEKRPAEDHV